MVEVQPDMPATFRIGGQLIVGSLFVSAASLAFQDAGAQETDTFSAEVLLSDLTTAAVGIPEPKDSIQASDRRNPETWKTYTVESVRLDEPGVVVNMMVKVQN